MSKTCKYTAKLKKMIGDLIYFLKFLWFMHEKLKFNVLWAIAKWAYPLCLLNWLTANFLMFKMPGFWTNTSYMPASNSLCDCQWQHWWSKNGKHTWWSKTHTSPSLALLGGDEGFWKCKWATFFSPRFRNQRVEECKDHYEKICNINYHQASVL